jgi:carboxymethylenebutenolidase
MVNVMKKTISLSGEGGEFTAYVTAPEGSEKRPGLVLIEEIWGVNDHIKSVCDRYAAEGFVVISPELLPPGALAILTPEVNAALFDPEKRAEVQPKLREAMQPTIQPEYGKATVAKLKACVDYLLAEEHSNGKVGVIGFCFGGTYTFQLAMHDSRIKAAVPFYGRLSNTEAVETISCPVLNFDGAEDEGVMAQVPALETAMKQYNKDYTHVVYPDAGHAFFNDTNVRAYRPDAAKDAWEKSLAFLKKNLA